LQTILVYQPYQQDTEQLALSCTAVSALQASFFKIDIDNPDVQTSVSNHEITGVVRANMSEVGIADATPLTD